MALRRKPKIERPSRKPKMTIRTSVQRPCIGKLKGRSWLERPWKKLSSPEGGGVPPSGNSALNERVSPMYSVAPKTSVLEPSVAIKDGMPTTTVKKALKAPQ